MRRLSLLAAVAAGVVSLAGGSRVAQACGGCFHDPNQPQTVVTDHRMIFRVTPQQTTLYDEIEYSGDPAGFAWVLPIHGPVAVGLSADAVFAAFEQLTATTVVPPQPPQCPFCPSCPDESFTDDGPSSDAHTSNKGDAAPVTVIGQSVVGPYETVQLSSTKPKALERWLAANGFSIPADVQPVVAAYVTAGFDFLALKLLPGKGVQAMRPVRVTSPGAGLTLPLRMVAAGTGAVVGITLWVVGDGLYEPQNFPTFVISPSELVWDFSAQLSNYTTLRSQKEAALGGAGWQMESVLALPSSALESLILGPPASVIYAATPASDAGAGETADQVRQDDLATLFPEPGAVQVTRMRADLSRAALGSDLVLQGSNDAAVPRSNLYEVTQSIHGPVCTPMPDPCPPPVCDYGDAGDDGGDAGDALGGGRGGGSQCSGAPGSSRGSAPEFVFAGLLGATLLRGRGTRGRTSREKRR